MFPFLQQGLLSPDKLRAFLDEKIRSIGTSACPPYHLAIVIGGLSAEQTLKTVKLTSCRYLDTLPTSGDQHGRAFRDLEMEKEVLEMTRQMGIGAQFGGKYFCHDVRVVRLPRHGASLPVGIGVSCSADRQALAIINKDGGETRSLLRPPSLLRVHCCSYYDSSPFPLCAIWCCIPGEGFVMQGRHL